MIQTQLKYFKYNQENEIGVLTIATSPKINQFSLEALAELNEILSAIEKKSDLKALIINAEGKAFAAGANISQMAQMSPDEGEAFGKLGQETFDRIENLDILTIAAVNGTSVGGGCELCLSCDYRIATEKALFGQPEITIGLIPGWGGSRRLTRVVGKTFAAELIYSGRFFNAEEALKIGFLNKLVKEEELMNTAYEMAKAVTNKSKTIFKYAKKAFQAEFKMSDTEAELEERLFFKKCFESNASKEGMSAFLEKRQPEFKE